MPYGGVPFTDLISNNVDHAEAPEKLPGCHNYTSSQACKCCSSQHLSACGILRGTVQSVALCVVHGYSVSLPRNLRVKPGAGPPSAAVSGGGSTSQCRVSPGFDCLFSCPETCCVPHQVTHSCTLDTGCWSRGDFCQAELNIGFSYLMNNLSFGEQAGGFVFHIWADIWILNCLSAVFTVSAFTVNLTLHN